MFDSVGCMYGLHMVYVGDVGTIYRSSIQNINIQEFGDALFGSLIKGVLHDFDVIVVGENVLPFFFL